MDASGRGEGGKIEVPKSASSIERGKGGRKAKEKMTLRERKSARL